jgi:hypothetical protein
MKNKWKWFFQFGYFEYPLTVLIADKCSNGGSSRRSSTDTNLNLIYVSDRYNLRATNLNLIYVSDSYNLRAVQRIFNNRRIVWEHKIDWDVVLGRIAPLFKQVGSLFGYFLSSCLNKCHAIAELVELWATSQKVVGANPDEVWIFVIT